MSQIVGLMMHLRSGSPPTALGGEVFNIYTDI